MQKVSISDYLPLPEGKSQFSFSFIEANAALILNHSEDQIAVGLVKFDDFLLRAEIESAYTKKISFFSIPKEELSEYLSRKMSDGGSSKSDSAVSAVDLEKLANDAPIINLVNNILLEAIRLEASDIHLEAFEQKTRIRFRIDGTLRTTRNLDHSIFPALASRIKVMAHLNIIEKRLPQDGRLSVHLSGRTVEFRVSTIPIISGESLVLRVFRTQETVKNIESLGFTSAQLTDLRECSSMANGLVLITGPTGSGKTTTLNALMKEINSEARKIITIEDPIENVIEGINQIQTNETIGLTFDTILRRILRQDPDILMVGEIRDKKTAELSLRSALTGHLVFSTLHTNDALASIPRLINMGIEPFLLAAVLRGVTAQRLVRKICPHCKGYFKPTPAEYGFMKKFDICLDQLAHGTGCKHCHSSGYLGRTVISEIFLMDDYAEELISKDSKKRDYQEFFKSNGKKFLVDSGIDLLINESTTIEELERVLLLI